MATILSFTHSSPGIPLTLIPDFIVQIEACEHLADALEQIDDPAQYLLLCEKLHACLAQLQPTLFEPIPANLTDSFTADTLPVDFPRFEPDCTDLCRYSMTLTQILAGNGLSSETQRQTEGLLYELISFLAAEMKAPRWLRTADGLQMIM